MNENFFNNKQIVKGVTLALVFLSLFLLIKTASVLKEYHYIGFGIMPTKTITVSGSGEVSATADTAEFSFSVIESAKTVAAAQTASTNKIKTIVDYLKSAGIEEKDIKTENYNVYPKYENRAVPVSATPQPTYSYDSIMPTMPVTNSVIVGYETSQTITVKTKDTDKAGELIGKVGSLGVSNISGVNFTFGEPEKLQNEARSKAIADAREEASILAKELGVSLGRVTTFDEGNRGPYYYGMDADSVKYAASAPTASPVIPMGENKIVSNVTITYEI